MATREKSKAFVNFHNFYMCDMLSRQMPGNIVPSVPLTAVHLFFRRVLLESVYSKHRTRNLPVKAREHTACCVNSILCCCPDILPYGRGKSSRITPGVPMHVIIRTSESITARRRPHRERCRFQSVPVCPLRTTGRSVHATWLTRPNKRSPINRSY